MGFFFENAPIWLEENSKIQTSKSASKIRLGAKKKN
jgi:hypothetical protein